MLPKDLTPPIIEKLKQIARTYPTGSIPAGFDPNNFVFHSNNGLTLMLTAALSSPDSYWLLSMSFPRRAPHEEEAEAILQAFFNNADEAGLLMKPAGSNPNVQLYRVPLHD